MRSPVSDICAIAAPNCLKACFRSSLRLSKSSENCWSRSTARLPCASSLTAAAMPTCRLKQALPCQPIGFGLQFRPFALRPLPGLCGVLFHLTGGNGGVSKYVQCPGMDPNSLRRPRPGTTKPVSPEASLRIASVRACTRAGDRPADQQYADEECCGHQRQHAGGNLQRQTTCLVTRLDGNGITRIQFFQRGGQDRADCHICRQRGLACLTSFSAASE